MRRPYTLATSAVPALVGLAIGFGMELGVVPLLFLVFHGQVSVGVVAAIIGIAISASIIAWSLIRRWSARQVTRVLETERQEQAEARRRFVQRLNHELRNPLTAIRACLANLEQQRSNQSIRTMDQQVERLGRLANDLRKLVDLETRQLECEPVDIAMLIDEAVELSRAVPGRQDRTVAVQVQHIPWDLSPVQGDADLLLLAVYNLLDNALKYTAQGAAIEIRATDDGTTATIAVVDTGCGIRREEVSRVTEELYRGTQAQGVEGSGLGLALVERIVALHSGEFHIRSREGQGTVAEVRIPLAQD